MWTKNHTHIQPNSLTARIRLSPGGLCCTLNRRKKFQLHGIVPPCHSTCPLHLTARLSLQMNTSRFNRFLSKETLAKPLYFHWQLWIMCTWQLFVNRHPISISLCQLEKLHSPVFINLFMHCPELYRRCCPRLLIFLIQSFSLSVVLAATPLYIWPNDTLNWCGHYER